MYTVYGIYKKWQRKPLYIGYTIGTLSSRLYGHITKGCLDHDRQLGGPIVKLRSELMHKHANGIVNLRIRPIAQVDTYSQGLKREREEISKHKPVLNAQSYIKPKVIKMLPGRRTNSLRMPHVRPQWGNPLRARVLAVREAVSDKRWITTLAVIDRRIASDRVMLAAVVGGRIRTISEEQVLRIEAACRRLMALRAEQETAA